MTEKSRAETPPSLDHTFHDLLSALAPARVAAMQILVYHVETSKSDESQVPANTIMAASADLKTAQAALAQMYVTHLNPMGIVLPESVGKMAESLSQSLAELTQITSRCAVDEDGQVKGFHASADMYDLCCTRVAQGISGFSEALSKLFLELMDKDKADALDKTSTIAMEIGKIGRVINMVATNASIEAARVGDAGKGFTVIADEVKVLSSRVSSLSVSLTNRLT